MPHLPIDHLFRSLAAIQKSRAIGVVLSGNGTDGVVALQAIKAAGGVTFAQDEKTAQAPEHAAMPPFWKAASITSCGRATSPGSSSASPSIRTPAANDARPSRPVRSGNRPVTGIIELLRNETDVDFTHYKQSTIRRRILRRMALRNLQDPGTTSRSSRMIPPRSRTCTRIS